MKATTYNLLFTRKKYMDKNYIKTFKNGKEDVGIKIVKHQEHWNKVGLFATQGCMGIGRGLDMHRTRRK